MKYPILAAAALLYAGAGAVAQDNAERLRPGFSDAATQARWERYIDSAPHMAAVDRLWRQHTRANCEQDLTPTDLERLAVDTDPTPFLFGELAAHPARGTWSERWRGTACGFEAVLNFLFAAEDDDIAPIAGEIFPGFTEITIAGAAADQFVITVARSQIDLAAGDGLDTSCGLNGRIITPFRATRRSVSRSPTPPIPRAAPSRTGRCVYAAAKRSFIWPIGN